MRCIAARNHLCNLNGNTEEWGESIKTVFIAIGGIEIFGKFFYVNEAKALQQISTLELSLEAQPGARAKLFMKLHTSYSCDPVRENEPLFIYLS